MIDAQIRRGLKVVLADGRRGTVYDQAINPRTGKLVVSVTTAQGILVTTSARLKLDAPRPAANE